MDLVVLPAKALCDANPPPFALRQQAQHVRIFRREEMLWQVLEHALGQDHVTVFVAIVRISLRVVNPGPPLSRRLGAQ